MMATYEAKKHYQEEEVAAVYDRARFRGLRGALVNWLEQRLLMKAMEGVRAGGRVLDLPVGTGRMARRLSAEGYCAIGADVSLAMMRLAAELADEAGTKTDLLAGDAEALPFADRQFDVAVCFRLLSHLPSEARRGVLREMARVTSDRVIAVYQPHKVAVWWFVFGLLLRRPVPLHYVSAADLEREFAACGLRPIRSHALFRGLFMERAYVLEHAARE